jgi:hypothetical protein
LCTCSAVTCPTSNFIKNFTLEKIFQPWLQINFFLSNCFFSYCHHLKLFLATPYS